VFLFEPHYMSEFSAEHKTRIGLLTHGQGHGRPAVLAKVVIRELARVFVRLVHKFQDLVGRGYRQ
jgi:hypothetical protein